MKATLKSFPVRGMALVVCVLLAVSAARADDPLPSWNEGATKAAIVDFVTAVTKEGGPDYVPPAERIATFDNDGCLWVEQPMYTQLAFAFDRVNAMASDHPEWEDSPALKAVMDGDRQAVAKTGKKGLEQILMVSPTPACFRMCLPPSSRSGSPPQSIRR